MVESDKISLLGGRVAESIIRSHPSSFKVNTIDFSCTEVHNYNVTLVPCLKRIVCAEDQINLLTEFSPDQQVLGQRAHTHHGT